MENDLETGKTKWKTLTCNPGCGTSCVHAESGSAGTAASVAAGPLRPPRSSFHSAEIPLRDLGGQFRKTEGREMFKCFQKVVPFLISSYKIWFKFQDTLTPCNWRTRGKSSWLSLTAQSQSVQPTEEGSSPAAHGGGSISTAPGGRRRPAGLGRGSQAGPGPLFSFLLDKNV